LQFRHPRDHWHAIGVAFDLSVLAALGRTNFDEAHPAHPNRLQFGMIAKDRDVNANLFRGFDDEGAVGDLNLFVINCDLRHFRLPIFDL